MKSKTRKADGKASLDPLVRRWFCGSIEDRRMKSGIFYGEVRCLSGRRWKRVALVYGETLKIMRYRKHAIVDMLNQSSSKT